MTKPTGEYSVNFEQETHFYVDLIRDIDLILKRPVQTLIRLAEIVDNPEKDLGFPAKKVVYFPPWISANVMPSKGEHLLTWSLCSETLQRLWRVRRRLTWLEEKDEDDLKTLVNSLVNTFTPKASCPFDDYVLLLKSHVFGGLNPLTASHVSRVFLNSSEAEAHSGVGFLAFFAILWALRRRFPDPLSVGAAIDPWEPSAYVTARCLLPINTSQKICQRRAGLFKQVHELLTKLREPAVNDRSSKSWQYSVKLDELVTALMELSGLAIDRGDSIRKCAKVVATESESLSVSRNNQGIYKRVLAEVGAHIIGLGTTEGKVLESARPVLDWIDTEINRRLTADKCGDLPKLWDLRFAEEYVRGADANDYWDNLRIAAENSLKVCKQVMKALMTAANGCRAKSANFNKHALKTIETGNEAAWNAILEPIKALAVANERVSELIGKPAAEAARWCHSVVNREIANASAGKLTDFDASELVSGIAVAVRWNLMQSSLDVSDAVKKAVEHGAREDGSWSHGQPFYSPDYATAISPRTSDIVWTLTSAIEVFPEVEDADPALFRYVKWLERTRTRLGDQAGWASDRLRHPRKIHLATTALSINALLEIRDLIEYRLWNLCKKRFSRVEVIDKLHDVNPVDLGAKNRFRLHSRIANIARKARGEDYDKAEYSFVLHGPTGTSKTMLAEALSAEMWSGSSRWGRDESRLVRITPADFTRMGEDRLDAEARLIFELLSHVRGVTIFFDEIDDLLRRRDARNVSLRFLDLVVPAMLNRLADLRKACPSQEICFLLATNYVERIEPALIRGGRIDQAIPVVYPDWESRLAIIDKKVKPADREKIAARTARWPFLMIKKACDEITTSRAPLAQILTKKIPDPEYKRRLKERRSPELVNEYLHYMMAQARDLAGCRNRVDKKLRLDFERIWKAEERLI